MIKWVSTSAGVPTAPDFATTGGYGSPLVVNLATYSLSFLDAAGVIQPIVPGAGTVTLAMIQNIPTATVLYRKTAGAGPPEAQSLIVLKQDIGLTDWKTLFQAGGSHTAARVAGTYFLGYGDPAGITGTGTLYPPVIFYLAAADFPTAGGVTAKLRIRANIQCNDVAPVGTYTVGLHPVTRPAVSGGAGVCIYTIGAAIASIAVVGPAADSSNTLVSAEFALPADGYYVLGFVTTNNVAANAHVHICAWLQQRVV